MTGFHELDELLEDFVARVSEILGDDLVGAYLTGSFALGGADRHSDADFVVVTAKRFTARVPLTGELVRSCVSRSALS